jgi:hypothetical protein
VMFGRFTFMSSAAYAKYLSAAMVSICFLGGVPISTLASAFTSTGLGILPHSDSGVILKPALNLVDHVVVLRPISLRPADNPHERRGRVDPLCISGQSKFFDKPVFQVGSPARRRDQEMLSLCRWCASLGTQTHQSTCRAWVKDNSDRVRTETMTGSLLRSSYATE